MPAGSTVSSRRLRGARLRLVLLPLACALDLPEACANDLDDVEFDAGMLKQRGIDPKLAGYFRRAPRFTAGRHVVSLTVNGKLMGRAQANFDETGALCVDRELLDAADIVVTSASACTDLVALLPRASVELDPARGGVSLLVPTDVLRTPQQDVSGYARGGTAALLNYEVIGLDSRWSSSESRYGSANTELGINAGDWVVRSRQVATSSDGRYRTALLDTYAQRSFAEHRAVLQLGELNIMNPALAGAQITGIQVMSEQALATQAGGAIVEGVASSQARVDVRQDGVLVYSTVVPAGPFALTSIPRINRHGRLDVTVVGAGGEKHQFVVSPAMSGSTALSAGYSLAAGRTRNLGGIDAPWVASLGWSGPLHRRLTLSSGSMLASGYQSVGVGFGSSLAATTQLQIDVVGSRAARDRASGVQGTLTLSQRLGEQWSAAYSSSLQSGGFRELVDTARIGAAAVRRTRYRGQSSASLSWSHPGLGNLGAGYSQTVLFDGRTTRRALASWGARMGRASVSVSAEWNLSHSRRSGDNAIYFNASVPLGDSGRIGTTVRRYVGETRYGTSFSEQVNKFASYRAGFEYRSGDRRRSLTSAVSLLPRYVQLDASYAQDTRSRSVSLALRGGLVLHDHGVTASPYAVRDTFGVLSVGDTAGVRVSTPGGPVWTDARGYAVLPQLSPYGKSGIEVATDSLPRNMDIQGGAAVIQAGRGAVTTLDFPVRKTRRVLVSARMDDGRVLPFGATVTDGQGDVVGVVQGGGEVFVPNILATPHLTVRHADIPDCELDIRLHEQRDLNAYYESAAAVCQPGGEGL